MSIWEQKLTGALVGLARCIDGAQPSAETFAVFSQAVLTPASADEKELRYQIAALHAEKAVLLPDCMVCQHPCGRRADMTAEEMERDEPAVRQIKQEILSLVRRLCACDGAGEKAPLLYKAVFAIGEDADLSWFAEIQEELQAALASGSSTNSYIFYN